MAVESSSVATSEEFVESSQTTPPVGAMTNAEDRHPLQDSWSLWYLTADKTKDRFTFVHIFPASGSSLITGTRSHRWVNDETHKRIGMIVL